MNINYLVDLFKQKYSAGIANLYNIYIKDSSQLTIDDALILLTIDLLKETSLFFSKPNNSEDDLNPHLFYFTLDFFKNKGALSPKKKTEYLCPGCLYLGRETIVEISKHLNCNVCENFILIAIDGTRAKELAKVFAYHNKIGVRCSDCNRFLPLPLNGSKQITCPYLDCCFVGDVLSLKKMNHPTLKANTQTIITPKITKIIKPTIIIGQDKRTEAIKNSIETLSNNVPYDSNDFTIKHKLLAYKAFANLLDSKPEQMTAYLLDGTRTGGFQHKVFQEYIKLLEKSLPFQFIKAKKKILIESLLDPNLGLFDGISVFEAEVNAKLEIKNNTKEFYIGNKKSSYTEPYYIGKLLSVIDNKKNLLMDNVIEYSFLKIKLKDVLPNTKVIVTHLRVPPHYQMGGMVYINRVRKKIIDQTISILE